MEVGESSSTPQGTSASSSTPEFAIPATPSFEKGDLHAEVVVLGAGPVVIPQLSVLLIWANR